MLPNPGGEDCIVVEIQANGEIVPRHAKHHADGSVSVTGRTGKAWLPDKGDWGGITDKTQGAFGVKTQRLPAILAYADNVTPIPLRVPPPNPKGAMAKLQNPILLNAHLESDWAGKLARSARASGKSGFDLGFLARVPKWAWFAGIVLVFALFTLTGTDWGSIVESLK